jgi:hypothetical protein
VRRPAGGRRRGRWAALLTVTALAGALLLPPDAPAAADSCDGVWVVVDASELGAGVTTRCAPGDPSSGLRALEAAGHSYTFVPRQPGMVCTIDRRPDPCNGAPTNAYWSYWHAQAGGSWTYSSTGAGSRKPEPGTVEGWAFGAGAPPSVPPPAAPEDTSGSDDGGGTGGGGGTARSSGGSTGGTSGATSSTGSSGTAATPEEPAGSSDDASGSHDGDGGGSSPETDDRDGAASDGTEEAEARVTASTDDEDAPSGDATADDDGDGRDEPDGGEAGHRIEEPPVRDRDDDVVALEGANRSGGRSAAGALLGGTLVTAIATAAALRARRGPSPVG